MIEALWLVLRAAGFVLTFQAAGTALFVAAFARELGEHAPLAQRLGRRAAFAALALLALQLLGEPLHLAGEWAAVSGATLRALEGSSASLALVVCAVGLGWLALALRPAGGPLTPRVRLLAALGAALAVGSQLLTGHTVGHPGRAFSGALLFMHLAIVAFWFGSLGLLHQLTLRAQPADAARLIGAFSAAAVWLVPLIALAGAGMALVLLPGVAALRQPYGQLLLIKAALFALLMGLAARNRLRLLPALARATARAPARLARSIALEYALLVVVFIVTAVMTGEFSPQGD